MPHRPVVLAALAAVVLTGGCGLIPAAGEDSPRPPAATTGAPDPAPSPTPSGRAESGLGSVKDAGDLPDPCTLLSEPEVTELTGRDITQVDTDGGAGDVTRYCQWQQESGQLAVFLTRTTPADFQVTVAEAEPVGGVGEDAFWHSGHLFVLYGTVQIDVYSRGASDEQNRNDAVRVAEALIPRV